MVNTILNEMIIYQTDYDKISEDLACPVERGKIRG
jgi:hypothetical protein